MVLGETDTLRWKGKEMIPIGQLKLLLTKAGLEFKIVRVEGSVAHVNILVAEGSDVHS